MTHVWGPCKFCLVVQVCCLVATVRGVFLVVNISPPFTLQITLAEYMVVSRSGFASAYPAFREPSIVKDYHKKNASTIIG